jgi:A/G-specific adenine glycosylase
MHQFSEKIISWYEANKRDLPWRNTSNSYFIWLSEVILQQTRVNQGVPYYVKFIEQYPTVKHLAEASIDEVLKLWQGLGYYSRARNLHYTAQEILRHYKGQFPVHFQQLIQLKGIGRYTAAAISSFSINERQPVVDGNVYRVLSRVFAIDLQLGKSQTEKYFYELANELIPEKEPGKFNQAIMELGATVCLPKNPNCNFCPLQDICLAKAHQKIDLFPVKKQKIKTKKRYFNFYLIDHNDQVVITKRESGDIWEGLYIFPHQEFQSESEMYLNDHLAREILQKKHLLTHQTLIIRCLVVGHLPEKIDQSKLIFIDKKDFHKFAVPKPIEYFWKKKKNN